MKKLLCMLIAASLIISCLAGCGQKSDPAPQPDPEPEKLTAAEIYERFLCGDYSALYADDTEGLEKGVTYDISALSYGFCAWLQGTGFCEDAFLDRVFYADIDCGLDGEPEMALKIGYQLPRGEYYENYTICCVLKAFDQDLKIVSLEHEYYRTYTDVNTAGMIYTGGSNSAISWSSACSYVNAEGEKIFLYVSEYYADLAEAAVPYYLVPLDMQDSGYSEIGVEYRENGVYMSSYNFTDSSALDMSDEKAYDSFLRDYIFCFTDADGNDVPVSEKYANLYEENGLKIVTKAYLDAFLETYLKEMGVPEGTDTAEPADWKELTDAEWMPKG